MIKEAKDLGRSKGITRSRSANGSGSSAAANARSKFQEREKHGCAEASMRRL